MWECADLGLRAEPLGHGVVRVAASPEAAALVWAALRTVPRVSLELRDGLPSEEADLGRAVLAFPWEEWLPPGLPWAVRARGRTPRFRHTLFAARWLKDRIRERFARAGAPCPPVHPRAPALLVDLWLTTREAAVGLSAGESLHRRTGPRSAAAPLREDVAAGLAWLAGAGGRFRLADPFCGSGTLIAEAVAVARRMPRARGLPAPLWQLPPFRRIGRERLAGRLERRIRPLPAPAAAADRDAAAVARAERLLVRAGLRDDVQLEVAEVGALALPVAPHPTLVLCNPPWGRRLAGETEGAWRALGRWVRSAAAGGRLAALSGDPRLTRPLGLKAARRFPVRVGGVDARLCLYEVSGEPRA